MKKLNYELKNICDRNRDGSYATQANRARILSQVADQLSDLGFKTNGMSAHDLKGRHINRLVNHWKQEGISSGTIKNRMAALRWWAEKIGNPGAINPDNAAYGIADREYVTNEDKSIKLSEVDLKQCSPHVAMSLQLQSAFGLRREEAMKFMPSYALQGISPDKAEKIALKPSWTKGGRAREIPIVNDFQREMLKTAAVLAGSGSLIPPERNYREHIAVFERESRQAGAGNTHGLRHDYAQRRYREITGIDCPSVRGCKIKDLSFNERALDAQARRVITQELGHGRVAITAVYLGG